jgi:hypothetical protein
MPRAQGFIYIGLMVVISCIFQYHVKMLANGVAPILAQNTGLAEKIDGLLHGAIVARLAFVLTLASTLFVVWVLALTKLDLSVALPLAAVTLVVNAVGTGILLGEELSLLRIGGVVTVALGIAMILNS